MRNFVTAAAFAAGANALVGRGNSCCFHLKSSGGASGSIGQLDDGQNRVYGNLEEAQFCIDSNGAITDANGRGCIVTGPTTQWQCDQGASPTAGFSINSEGQLSYQGDSEFVACQTGQNGGMNIYTTESQDVTGCVDVKLTADSCSGSGAGSGGSGSASVPAPSSTPVIGSSSIPVPPYPSSSASVPPYVPGPSGSASVPPNAPGTGPSASVPPNAPGTGPSASVSPNAPGTGPSASVPPNAPGTGPSASAPPAEQTTTILTTVTATYCPINTATLPGGPGVPGTTGVPGVPGTTGVSGTPGVPGGPGVPGTPGVPGVPGVPGTTGVPGVPGTTGVPGVPGTPG
ncbi:uncharacterized protein KD926_001115, partial [Aspergillus affinis]|uniref:uncharacterized protein n=1 Tax=Aspergillus affinis TaxID=1070780 RepID=UPI0022FEEA9F